MLRQTVIPVTPRRFFLHRRLAVLFFYQDEEGETMLQKGDAIGICACSNGLGPSGASQLNRLEQVLAELSLTPVYSPCLYGNGSVFSAPAAERAEALMALYRDDRIRAVFDVSGGDLANEVLEFLDYDLIRNHPKPFWGYSDLTCVLNALYTKTGAVSGLYQLRNLVGEQGEMQQARFRRWVLEGQDDLYRADWRFLQGNAMEGVVIGGNIRCFLKLAGTPYLPDVSGKILFLESRSGGPDRIAACLAQLRQMGAFSQIRGLLLGTFTEMERTGAQPAVTELVRRVIGNPELPIAVTGQIGHGPDSRCLLIGKNQIIRQP